MDTLIRKRGRPEGSHNKLAREAREKAQQSGQLPHEILLDMARGNPQPIKTAELDPETGEVVVKVVGWEVPDLEQRKDAAKAAAPYFAPKISTVEVIKGVEDGELDEIIKRAAAEAGLSLGIGGEGEEGEGEGGEASADPPAPERKRVKRAPTA